MKMHRSITDPAALEALRRELMAEGQAAGASVSVCCGTGCRASGALEVVEAFKQGLAARELPVKVNTRMTGCHGFCEQGPLVVLEPGNIFYCRVQAADVEEIISRTIVEGQPVERLLYLDSASGRRILREENVPFYRGQERLLLAHNGRIEPASLADYLAVGGYAALAKALTEMTPEQVIAEIKVSGLRGRGGGGFPTALKWEICRRAEGTTKYVVCNADEGDPGCFQDRSLLEGNPHSVLEGMLIGAYAVGAEAGYVYVRHEYPLAIAHLSGAINEAREYGLLGRGILGTGFNFELKISRGGGAFVCGEETALISSIEGITGEPNPRPRPPYPAVQGLWGCPTVINNVKTWATVPPIINKGGQWFAATGTAGSKGTMIFSLTGKVNNTGLVEVPMGITLREIVFNLGGGIRGGKKIKAVQTGGPAGGCIPEALLDLPLDYEQLTEAGSMMGSGGLIVMDETTCMVDLARYFLSFTQDESCGKCTPCREGGAQLLHLLEKITKGQGAEEDLELIAALSAAMQDSSLCALGKLAPNPVLTTLRFFRDEYLAHIVEKRCPAGVCRSLIRYVIDSSACTGCGRCRRACPAGAVQGTKKEPHLIDQEKCTRCGACLEACRFAAVLVN